MKICPKCRNQYTDASLRYCLQDGATLVDSAAEKTEVFDASDFSAAETVAIEAQETAPEAPPEAATVAQHADIQAPVSVPTLVNEVPADKKRSSGFLAGLLVGILFLGIVALVGLGIWFGPALFGKDEIEEPEVAKTLLLKRAAVSKISASSVRRRNGTIDYIPENAFDGVDSTAWCEGARGAGKQEWIRFDFVESQKLNGIKIKLGYFKSRELWEKNNRIASIELTLSNNYRRIYEFPDSQKERTIELPDIETDFVKISIRDVYPGRTDSLDTLISEIGFTSISQTKKQ